MLQAKTVEGSVGPNTAVELPPFISAAGAWWPIQEGIRNGHV